MALKLPTLQGQTTLVERVCYQLLVGTSLVFVTGGAGAGKTVFCEQLCASLPKKYGYALVPCTCHISSATFRSLLVHQIAPDIEFDAQAKLPTTLANIKWGNKAIVIVIDNIDVLSKELLNELAEVILAFQQQEKLQLVVTSSKFWSDLTLDYYPICNLTPVEIEIASLAMQDRKLVLSYYLNVHSITLSDQDLLQLLQLKNASTPEAIRIYAQDIADNKENNMTANSDGTSTKESNATTLPQAKHKVFPKFFISMGLIFVMFIVVILGYIWLQQPENESTVDSAVPTTTEQSPVTPDANFAEQQIVDSLPDTLEDNPVVVDDVATGTETKIVVDDETLNQLENLENNPQVVPADNKASSVTSSSPAKSVGETSVTKVTTPKTNVKVPTQQSKGQKDFASLNSDHYSVQVVATKSKADAQTFAKQMTSECWILLRNKDQNYILLCGDYVTLPQAKASIARLPADLQKLGPWAKQIRNIRQEIK